MYTRPNHQGCPLKTKSGQNEEETKSYYLYLILIAFILCLKIHLLFDLQTLLRRCDPHEMCTQYLHRVYGVNLVTIYSLDMSTTQRPPHFKMITLLIIFLIWWIDTWTENKKAKFTCHRTWIKDKQSHKLYVGCSPTTTKKKWMTAAFDKDGRGMQ